MLKRIALATAIMVGTALALAAYGIYFIAPGKQGIIKFIEEHPEKSAILLSRNDTVIARMNADKVMPLASTMKIMVAIEYARQAAKGKIDADELVSLDELNKYYLPNTDGNAHPEWLKSVEGKIKNSRISVREIAKGMILYSSNANTEWLQARLGLDNINRLIENMELKGHTPVYYIVSSLLVGKEAFPGVTGKALQEKLSALSEKEYIKYTNIIHEKLLTDPAYKNDLGDLSLPIQRVWSDRLPAATVTDYVLVMKTINNREYLSPEEHEYLDEVMEYIFENPENKIWLEHYGQKGGSTEFVLTTALYATDKKGNKTEYAYFFNDLTALEYMRLRASMHEFEIGVLTSREYREEVKARLLK